MQLTRTSKTSDRYGRYYTDQKVANLLIRSIYRRTPKLILDLGSGGGVLVNAARKKWTTSEFITADIDNTTVNTQDAESVNGSAKHYVVDALSSAIDKKIGVPFGSVDISLCNPPYVRPKWRKHFGEILESAGLSQISPQLGSLPAEVLFVAQNLRFLQSGGKLGLILPDGIISGEKFKNLRSVLAQSHRIDKVVELPRRIFHRTDAKAHILVLSKNVSPNDHINVYRVGRDGVLTSPVCVPTEQAGMRLDFSYLVSRSSLEVRSSHTVTLRDFTQFIKRGTHSSAERAALTLPVFHTTDFVSDSIQIPSGFILKKSQIANVIGVFAEKGDILIARVGRNLSKKVCMVKHGYVLISDCVIALRICADQRAKVFNYLVSEQGSEALESISHGVGAKFVTIDGILALSI
ncbi:MULTISPECIES: N-6 DNA methylase [unclassified Janthinobacterium]|uniref:N-6 DNA methylase n=1 Tax=unclassified Janthinobacterium TaxID=2610881 RepID=UPI001E3AF4CA|nr:MULTISPECIES: N-6 DNA methylase [unclassified Janthinobacterium]MCC7641636.1 SAM-dependent DNA methyltransferase [Janthinobacterium sp. EB271-G4-3-1]MCC7690889.1 SAM-dependent DNA methyltransferase [Janthinobacterium sp. EB271-G4-3-2]